MRGWVRDAPGVSIRSNLLTLSNPGKFWAIFYPPVKYVSNRTLTILALWPTQENSILFSACRDRK
jgi:hypothetical protein